jgi:hypothetical protein
MKRPAKARHKSHMARTGRLFACSPGIDGVRRADAARAPSWPAWQAADRVFAAVRPGFVAQCMVEAAGRAGERFGALIEPDPRCLVRSARVAASALLPGMANPSRATCTRRGRGGRRQATRTCGTVQAKTDKKEYLAEVGAGPQRDVPRIRGYHCARVRRRAGPALGYFK